MLLQLYTQTCTCKCAYKEWIYSYYLWKRRKIYMLLMNVHSPCNQFKNSPEIHNSIYENVIPVLNLCMYSIESEMPRWLTDWMGSELSRERDDPPKWLWSVHSYAAYTVVKYAHCHSFELYWMCMRQKTVLHKYSLNLFFNNHLPSPSNACLPLFFLSIYLFFSMDRDYCLIR